MISIWLVAVFVAFVEITHLVGDWFLQTNEQALNKWQSDRHLFNHIAQLALVQVAVVWAFWVLDIANNQMAWLGLVWVLLNSLIHFIIDRNTAKANRHYNQINRTDLFWNMIGFDQFLHRLFYYLTALILWSVYS